MDKLSISSQKWARILDIRNWNYNHSKSRKMGAKKRPKRTPFNGFNFNSQTLHNRHGFFSYEWFQSQWNVSPSKFKVFFMNWNQYHCFVGFLQFARNHEFYFLCNQTRRWRVGSFQRRWNLVRNGWNANPKRNWYLHRRFDHYYWKKSSHFFWRANYRDFSFFVHYESFWRTQYERLYWTSAFYGLDIYRDILLPFATFYAFIV